MKKIFALLAALVLVFPIIPSDAGAKGGNGKDSLVALGDSIPFGYNLENHNHRPSRDAFPHLIGEQADLRVRNLGQPGWTTEDLLTALQTDEKFRQSVRHADYVTISIGNNDLLSEFSSPDDQRVIGQLLQGGLTLDEWTLVHRMLEVPALLGNLNQIITEIKSLSDAEIVLYNIYNPFFTSDYERYGIANALLNGINPLIAGLSDDRVEIADAFTAFSGGNHNDFLIPGDIHPTFLGQQELAEIGFEALY